MRISRKFAAVAVAALCLSPAAAWAQDTKTDAQAPAGAKLGPRAGANGQPAEGNAPKTSVVSSHGAWELQCTELPAEQGGKSCRVAQIAKNDKNEQLGLSVAFNRVKNGDKTSIVMQILAPIGVYLPTGIPVEIDGAAMPNRLPFTRCLPQVCESVAEASPESLAKFKKGTSATFFIYDRPGNGFPMKVQLKGFGEAMDALAKN